MKASDILSHIFFIAGCVFKDILIFDYIFMYRVVIGVSLLLLYTRSVRVVPCPKVVIVISLSPAWVVPCTSNSSKTMA